MRQVSGTTQSIRHTRSLRPKMNDLIATFNKLESGWANLQDVIHHMESREVDLAEFLLAVYGTPEEDSKRSKTIHKNRIEAIFQRIREEIANGNTPQMSISSGYEKAFSTIADANITTLIAAIVLFSFGTGPIKGFAVTLSLGIMTSMFTAITGTRAVVNLIYGGRKIEKLSI